MNRHQLAYAVFLAVLLAACGPSRQEQRTIDLLTQDMATHCMGRHLIDLPKSFRAMDGSAVKLYDGKNHPSVMTVTLVQEDATPKILESWVQLEAGRMAHELRDDRTSLLISNTQLDDNMYLLRGFSNGSTAVLKSALYLLRGTSVVSLVQETAQGDSPDATESRLKTTASKIRSIPHADQAGRGFCMGHIVIEGDHDAEQTHNYLNFSSDQSKDILWQIHIHSRGSGDEGERQSRLEAMTRGAASSVFQTGQISIATMPGQEVLAKYNGYGMLGLSFTAASAISPSRASIEQPFITVSMIAGDTSASKPDNAERSSWSKEEAIGVWHAVINSIRLRPDAL